MPRRSKFALEQEASDIVVKRFNAARMNQASIFNDFDIFNKLYEGEQVNKNYRGRANLFIPAPYWTVESHVPSVVRAFRKIRAAPRNPNFAPQTRAVEKLLALRSDQLNTRDFLRNWVRESAIYGSCPAKVGWDFKNDRPFHEVVDVFDFYIDPSATSIENAKYVIHRIIKDIEDLDPDIYHNLEKIKDSDGNRITSDEYKIARAVTRYGSSPTPDRTVKQVELLEYWGRYKDADFLIVVANGNTVIRFEENPFIAKGVAWEDPKPFVMLHDQDRAHDVWGVGEIRPIRSLVEELNDTRNQRMDNVTLIINRMWEVVKGADIDTDDFVSMPGKVFFSNIPNGIREISTPDVTRSAFEEEKIIKEDIQQTTTGTTRVNIPAAQKGETATGVLAIEQAGNTRFDQKILNMQSALEKLWRKIFALDQKFIDREIVIRIQGQRGFEFESLSPESIKGEFDVNIEVETEQNRVFKQQRALQLFTLASKVPGANMGKFFVDLLETYDKLDPEQYYQPPKPSPPQPQVSINLRGELNPLEVDDLAKQAGVTDSAADPLVRPEIREQIFPEEALIKKSLEHGSEPNKRAKKPAPKPGMGNTG